MNNPDVELIACDLELMAARVRALNEPPPPPPSGPIEMTGVVAGYDWTLPTGCQPCDRSGIYGYANNALVSMKTPVYSWADLHTGDGVYSWGALDDALAAGPLVLRLKMGLTSEVPAFVRNRHAWFSYAQKDGEVVIPGWQSGWLDEWVPFVNALGARYQDNPNLMGFQVQLATHGGEGGYKGSWIVTEESQGLTPTVYRDFLSAYHAACLAAFPAQPWKVFGLVKPYLFTGPYSGPHSEEAYAQAARDALLPLMDTGLGLRVHGRYEAYQQEPEWHQHAEIIDGELVTHDTTFGPLILRGHLDNQIENFYGGNQNGVATIDPAIISHAMRVAITRLLCEQHSFFWFDGDDAAFLDTHYPGFFAYAAHELGKGPADAPDAWLFLGEFGPIQAMPRWLRTTSLASTGPGLLVNTSGIGFENGDDDRLGRTFARLDLSLDARFMAGPADVTVRITYLADGATFQLETNDGRVSPVIGGDGGGWQTATLTVPACDPALGLALVAASGAPIVQLIRVCP